MSRLLSILLIGVGGYYLIKRRFRILNTVLGNPMIRRVVVGSVMSLPFVKKRMMNAVFSQQPAHFNPS
jgi:hypothetical protein